MRKYGFLLLMALGNVFAQDYHFTQYDKCLMLLNPSTVGNFDGFERFNAQNKNQWVGAGTRFMTSMASAEFTWGKTGFDNRSYLGMGMHYLRDVGGDARFGNNTVGASLGGHLVTSKRTKLSAGLQTAYTNRSGDFSNLLFYSQWNGTNFDPNIATNEPNQVATFNFVDAGVGLSFTYLFKDSRVAQLNNKYLNIGLFAQHITRPKLRYNDISFDRLLPKLGGHLQTELSLNQVLALEFKTIQMVQGKHYIGRYGMMLKYVMKSTASITRLKNDNYLSAGLYMSSTGTLSPCLLFDMGGLQFGVNYDLELARISRAYRSSLEFSLSYAFTKNSLFKRTKIG